MKFTWSNTTKVIFGVGEFARLGEEASKLGERALLVTGKTSAKKTGLVDRAIELLEKSGVETIVFDEIEPNPRSTTVDRAAGVVKETGCNLVIGLGGGSPMDSAKAIAVVSASGGSIWDYILSKPGKKVRPVDSALPIVTVPTLAATGSEANGGAVISNWELHEKAALFHPLMYSRFSIVDPGLTVTVSREYTGDGGIDIISHVLESYCSSTAYTPLQDRFSEGVIRTVMEHLPRAMSNGGDIEARTQLSWASTVALSGMVNGGRPGGFPLHWMEHVISAHYDISHGRGLAILMPHLMRYTAETAPDKYVQFARNVFFADIAGQSRAVAAEVGISMLERWMKSCGVYSTLSDVNIDSDKLGTMADDVIRIYGFGKDYVDNSRPLYKQDIEQIYRMAL